MKVEIASGAFYVDLGWMSLLCPNVPGTNVAITVRTPNGTFRLSRASARELALALAAIVDATAGLER
jgi:hypothetical protein